MPKAVTIWARAVSERPFFSIKGDLLLAEETGRRRAPRLVHERGGLQGLSGLLIGHPQDGELPQFLIDHREQLVGGFRIPSINGTE